MSGILAETSGPAGRPLAPAASSAAVLVMAGGPLENPSFAAAVREAGLEPVAAADGREAWEALGSGDIRLVLLARVLPGGEDGLRLCARIKRDPRWRFMPVVVVSGPMSLQEECRTYQSGADLVVRRDIPGPNLARYIRAFITRTPWGEATTRRLRCGRIALDATKRTAAIGGEEYGSLPAKHFDFLYLLASRQGGVVSRQYAVRKLWQNRVRDKEVDVLVSRLRNILKPEQRGVIEAVRGRGYRLNLGAWRPPGNRGCDLVASRSRFRRANRADLDNPSITLKLPL